MRTENEINVTYTVFYTCEYDLDEDGDAYTVYRDFDDYQDAKDAADDWERLTGHVPTIRMYKD